MTELDDTGKSRIIRDIEHTLGESILTALNDPRTIEVMLNADGVVWHEKLGEPMVKLCSMKSAKAEYLMAKIEAYHNRVIDKHVRLVEAEMPINRERFAGQLPPLVAAPTFAIRRPASEVFPLESYVKNEIMTQQQSDSICEAVKARKNILVIGGTSSGKTTLVNGIILEKYRAFPDERIVIIEDTGEIQCPADNFVQYHTSSYVGMSQLLKTTLRMRPDSIIVGEVRDGAALDMLDAWNTGHSGGIATIHANSTEDGLTRLVSMCTRNSSCPRNIEPLIGGAVQLIVYITKHEKSRKVTEILEVNGYKDGNYLIKKL